MLFDTGSSDLWVPAMGCSQCGGHQAFHPRKSTTYQPAKTAWHIQGPRGEGDLDWQDDGVMQTSLFEVNYAGGTGRWGTGDRGDMYGG